ncbi:major facilitator superfamily transporter [Fusarium tjaetaba]|uniref:Major facilitator superfamily transporter n=1 Tax=Fusarium tjaetaba TaxID=1567544 RepID=A0A8H5VCS7_9HYPO|nr:major facilitator superfamily transporter [Fusarium tjaetaba]KAF5617598.1 major facilitator superfamily transporter [Fusarium tjaetaba]
MAPSFLTVHFDDQNPNSEKGKEAGARRSLAGLDYSPLPRITPRSFLLATFVSMGGLLFGYDTGQISGFLEMPDFLDRFAQTNSKGEKAFSTVRSGLIVALLSIGTLMGALIAAPVADRIGRKYSISGWTWMIAIGFVIQISSDRDWVQIMMGRWVAGLGVGALSLLVPMFQGETAPPWIRGAMVCCYQLFITMGIFLAACFNYGTVTHHPNSSACWRIVIGVGWVFTLILGIGILFLPDTPRFDYRNGRVDRARDTLCKVYGATPNHWAIHTQMEEIESKLRAESHVKQNPVQEFVGMFKAPRMAYRIFIGMSLQMFQQLTGANYFFYYGTTIFQSVSINSYKTQIILNTINFLVTFIGLYIVEHYGRRKSLIAGSTWMFICFLVFASVGHFSLNRDDPTKTQGAGIAMIVFACLFILGFATTWGPMIWTIMAEIFPSRYRAKGMALSTASNWLWNFLLAFFTPFITKDIDFRYGYVFAGCNVLGGLLVYFFVIEGQGRTLEEIDTMYLEKVNPIKSAKWVPPPPEEMARIRKQAGTDLETAVPAASSDDETLARPSGVTDGGLGHYKEEHAGTTHRESYEEIYSSSPLATNIINDLYPELDQYVSEVKLRKAVRRLQLESHHPRGDPSSMQRQAPTRADESVWESLEYLPKRSFEDDELPYDSPESTDSPASSDSEPYSLPVLNKGKGKAVATIEMEDVPSEATRSSPFLGASEPTRSSPFLGASEFTSSPPLPAADRWGTQDTDSDVEIEDRESSEVRDAQTSAGVPTARGLTLVPLSRFYAWSDRL